MSEIGLIYVIGGIISAAIAIYWFYNIDDGEEQQIKVEDLFAAVVVAIFAFLVSWAGVISSLLVKYGDAVIIKRKKGISNERQSTENSGRG